MSIPEYPETHLERYLSILSGGVATLPISPENHVEKYLDYLTGGNTIPEYPETRVEKYLDHIAIGSPKPTNPETRIERFLDGTNPPQDTESRVERYLQEWMNHPTRKDTTNANQTNADVPTNTIKVSRVDKIGGASFKWNQLVTNGDFTSTSGWRISKSETTFSVSNNICTISYSIDGQGYQHSLTRKVPSSVQGHKYLVSQDVFPSVTGNFGFDVFNVVARSIQCPSDRWTQTAYIVAPSGIYGDIYCANNAYNTPAGSTVKIKNVMLIDITNIFGQGNEPTSTSDPRIKMLIAYAKEHPEYNVGNMVYSKPISVDSIMTQSTLNYFMREISLIKSRLESLGYSPDILGYSNGKYGSEWDGNYIDLVGKKVHLKYTNVNLGTLTWGESSGAWFTNSLIDMIDIDNGGALLTDAPYTNAGYESLSSLVNGQYTTRSHGVIYFKNNTYPTASAFKESIKDKYLVCKLKADETIIDVSDIIHDGRIVTEPGGTITLNTTEGDGHMEITWIKNGDDPITLVQSAPLRSQIIDGVLGEIEEKEDLTDEIGEFKPLEGIHRPEDLPYIEMVVEESNPIDKDS